MKMLMLRKFSALAIVLALPPLSLGANCPAGVTSPEATVPARLKSNIEPKYTQEALQSGVTGTALLGVKVDENGVPVEVKVLKWIRKDGESPLGLDTAAVEAVRQWRFYPKVAFCRAKASWVTVQVVFDFHLHPDQLP
jgi:TonB family protein